MASVKSISFSDHALMEIAQAKEIWPEHASNLSGIVCKIIAEWGRGMSQNGGKTERVIGRIDMAENRIVAEIQSIAAAQAAGCDCVAEYDADGMEK